MRIHVIACQVFSRELYALAAASRHVIELTLLPQGLHDTPDVLRRMVAQAVEQVERRFDTGLSKHLPDAIVLGYGLCSNGVVGVEAGRIPLVLPRTDDCIGIFLGSQQRYLELFRRYNGIYWLNHGWMESAFLPTRKQLARLYEEYREQYGEDNARYLIEQDQKWISNYRYCGYITSQGPWEREEYLQTAEETARDHGWALERFEGDGGLLSRLLSGEWDEKEFLICPPGCRIQASYDETKVKAVPASPERQGGESTCLKF